jgi:two-component sensor histidine kinase
MKWRLVAVAATALFPTIVSLGYNEFSVRQTYIADVYTSALRSSRETQFEVEQIIDEVAAVLYATATIDAVANHAGQDCVNVLKRLVAANAAIASMSMLGLDGRVLCSSQADTYAINFANQSQLKLAVATSGRAVGELVMDAETKQFELPIAVPVRNVEGQLVGVLSGDMPIPWLGERIRERGIATGAALTIADREGYIIARNPFPERFVGTRIPANFLHLINSNTPGTMSIKSQDGTQRILGYYPAGAGTLGLYVSAGPSEEEALAVINRVTASGLMAIVSGLVFGAAAAWFIGNRFIYRPVRQIVKTVAAWRAGAIDARMELTTQHGDLGAIGQALDEFIGELAYARAVSERAEARRDLLMSELGHRVKNTLAIAVSIANQMFRNSPEDRAAFSQRLAALAGAYDLLLADDWTSADINQVVEKTLAPHLGAPDQLDIGGPTLRLPSQIVLSLSLVLHELATNAVKYGSLSTPAGRLIVRWDVLPETDCVVVVTWQEAGGPPVEAPDRQGFGSKLLLRAFQPQSNSRIDLDYAPDGLKARIEFELPEETVEGIEAIA